MRPAKLMIPRMRCIGSVQPAAEQGSGNAFWMDLHVWATTRASKHLMQDASGAPMRSLSAQPVVWSDQVTAQSIQPSAPTLCRPQHPTEPPHPGFGQSERAWMWPPWWPRIQTKAARASGSATSAGEMAATAARAASDTSGYRRSKSFTCAPRQAVGRRSKHMVSKRSLLNSVRLFNSVLSRFNTSSAGPLTRSVREVNLSRWAALAGGKQRQLQANCVCFTGCARDIDTFRHRTQGAFSI